MSVLKKYNEGTSQWEAVVVGKQGNSGVVNVTAPITNSGTSTSAVLGFDTNFLGQAAGRNAIINGGFDFWQRGTSVTPASGFGFGPDRWRGYSYGSSTTTLSQQTFTPGTAPAAGYEGQYFMRGNSTNNILYMDTQIEDVRTFAGQTITLSFWAKAASAVTVENVVTQAFGTGGSSAVDTGFVSSAITTSWARYTKTLTFPSIAGKTIGTSNHIVISFRSPINVALDIWGIQLEAGSVATPFSRAGGTIAGELAACQRYYTRWVGNSDGAAFATGWSHAVNVAHVDMALPVRMRAIPSAIEYSNCSITDHVSYTTGGATVQLTGKTTDSVFLTVTSSGMVAGRYAALQAAGGYFAVIAEL